jgi:hypothetical protein
MLLPAIPKSHSRVPVVLPAKVPVVLPAKAPVVLPACGLQAPCTLVRERAA